MCKRSYRRFGNYFTDIGGGVSPLKIILYILTAFIILSISVTAYILYFAIDNIWIRIIGTTGLVLVIAVWLWIEYYTRIKKRKTKSYEEIPIKRLILVSPNGENEKEWHCEGATSFLIGKKDAAKTVDIELGDTHYADYISNEHAILNKMDGIWYIEDLGSVNGAGIRKKGEEYTFRLKPFVSYKIDEGDMLYISKAKILVR